MGISLCEVCVGSKRLGVRYVQLPIEDAEPVSKPDFEAIIKAVAQHIRTGNVLIHCGEGVSRAPSMTAAYMHIVGNKSLDASIAEIKRLRPYISPSKTLLNSIRRHLK